MILVTVVLQAMLGNSLLVEDSMSFKKGCIDLPKVYARLWNTSRVPSFQYIDFLTSRKSAALLSFPDIVAVTSGVARSTSKKTRTEVM